MGAVNNGALKPHRRWHPTEDQIGLTQSSAEHISDMLPVGGAQAPKRIGRRRRNGPTADQLESLEQGQGLRMGWHPQTHSGLTTCYCPQDAGSGLHD